MTIGRTVEDGFEGEWEECELEEFGLTDLPRLLVPSAEYLTVGHSDCCEVQLFVARQSPFIAFKIKIGARCKHGELLNVLGFKTVEEAVTFVYENTREIFEGVHPQLHGGPAVKVIPFGTPEPSPDPRWN